MDMPNDGEKKRVNRFLGSAEESGSICTFFRGSPFEKDGKIRRNITIDKFLSNIYNVKYEFIDYNEQSEGEY